MNQFSPVFPQELNELPAGVVAADISFVLSRSLYVAKSAGRRIGAEHEGHMINEFADGLEMHTLVERSQSSAGGAAQWRVSMVAKREGKTLARAVFSGPDVSPLAHAAVVFVRECAPRLS